jgi:hypothetical protein
VLRLKAGDRALYSDAAARRHRQLAALMGVEARLALE